MIERIAAHLVEVFNAGGKLLIIGNGGSAADASHIAAEFLGRYQRHDRCPLPAIPLTDPAVISAIGNDFGFANIFGRQIMALGRPGDCLIAISTSGNSANVLEGINAARRCKMSVIGLTGSVQMAGKCDFAALCTEKEVSVIQQNYMKVAHQICAIVDADF